MRRVSFGGCVSLSVIFLTFACPCHTAESGSTSDLEKESVWQVGFQSLLSAMHSERGYDPTATTNAARFQANVILSLARQSKLARPAVRQLMIDSDVWYAAFLHANQLSEMTAPLFARLAHEHQQDILVELRSNNFIKRVGHGDNPRLAVRVTASWSIEDGQPSEYAFEDTLSQPKLKVTNHHRITYVLLDFGDMIVYDDVEGLTGRPMNGLLAALFRLLGEGRIRQSRFTVAPDGAQLCRVHAQKGPFSLKTTVLVHPDGRMEKGVPKDRPDLFRLQERLSRPIKIEYHDFGH